jgi:CheY-like chemotaxis protein
LLTTAFSLNMKPEVRILIVEDEEFMATHIKRMLLRAGYGVSSVVASGERAVQAVAEDLPDVVLMDITLTDEMDGIEVVENIEEVFWIRDLKTDS